MEQGSIRQINHTTKEEIKMAVLKSKRTSYGLVEIKDSGVTGWYALYIDGDLKEQSADLSYIQRQYEKY
jgi:hypothetical protein